MENVLRNVKSIIESNIALLKKAEIKSVKNIEDFFEFGTSIPLSMLYTEEGLKTIEDKLFNTAPEYQNEVIEFLLRIKPDIVTIRDFTAICSLYLNGDIIIDKLYNKTDAKQNDGDDEREFTKLDYEIDNLYVLNLILAYNTAII